VSRFSYFTRETFISLRRNLLMTIAGIITVAVSLFLFGGIRLVQTVVDHGTSRWKHGVELEIFMKPDASQSEVNDVANALKADTPTLVRADGVRHLNKNDAYGEFKKIFRDQPALIESTTPDVLPESFRVSPIRAEQTQEVADKYKNRPGVDTVVTAQEQVKRLLSATRWINLVFTAIAIALLASSLFLIVNTIRLATFARRREIEVMKLVGASNWFVRVPFLAEGLAQGAIGAGIAFGFLYGLKVVIANLVKNRTDILQSFYVTNADAVTIGILVLFIGAGIGMIGSAIGLRRFLET
jgi:cell division transport system permease protein